MEPHPVHPVHPVLEDEDEDEEPPRILLYHGEPHGRAQGSGVRPRCPLAWGHSHTLGGGGRGSRQPRGRWLARQRHVAWPPSRALGTLAACLMGRRPATEPPGRGQSRGRRPHESAWRMGRTWGLGLGELLQACGVAVQSGWLWKASQVLQRGQGRGDLPLSPPGAAPPPRPLPASSASSCPVPAGPSQFLCGGLDDPEAASPGVARSRLQVAALAGGRGSDTSPLSFLIQSRARLRWGC